MHKINTAILTRFLFILDSTKAIQTGKTVTYEIRKPDDTVFASGNMTEIGATGIYKYSWTPNVVGWWIFKISCASPVANDVRAYFVESGLEKDIKDLLEHATYGLSALETLVDGVEAELTVIKGAGFVQATDALSKIRDAIDALNDLSQADILSDATPFDGADIATIKGYVDEIESLLKNGTYGLSALNTKLVAIQADLDNPNQYKADITGLALEATLTAMKGAGWTTETLKAIYDAMALESTLTAIKGGGWSNETLKAIKDAIDGLNDLSAASVWGYATRTLTDPNSYKADVSALALEATLGTHDTDIKADIGDFSSQTNLQSLLAALGIPDVSGKPLYTCLVTDRLDNATYGLAALETLIDEVESLLKNVTYGLSALKTEIDANETKIDTVTTNLGTHDTALGTHDTAIKALLEHATYGLSALETLVDEIESLLKNATYGLSALKTEIDANETKIDTVTTNLGTHDTDIKALLEHATYGLSALETLLDEVESLLKNATYGLSALKTEIDANETKIDNLDSDLVTHATALGTHDTDIKALLEHATYGLSALETLVDEVESLLKNATYGLSALKTEIDANETKIDTAISNLATHDTDIKALLEHATYGLAALETLVDGIEAKTDNLPASPAPASEYDTEMARITANVATEAKQDIIDTNVDDIETDTADIQPRVPRITCHMDFWSENDDEVVLTTTATDDHALPSCVVAGLPAGVTLIRVVALLKIAIIKDTSTADNAINGATALKVDADGGYGSLVTAIDIPDNSWAVDVSEATERGGDVMIGDNDIKAEVTQNATYYARLENIACDGNNLKLKDIAWGLRVYFTV